MKAVELVGLAGLALLLNDCTEPRCGDAIKDDGEQCDDGAADTATCDYAYATGEHACSSATCGDGYVNEVAGEVCDDGGDSVSCDADCSVRECGDGYVNSIAGEECDDGGDSVSCDADCSVRECGDGYVNSVAGEECDDRPNASSGICSTGCKRLQILAPLDIPDPSSTTVPSGSYSKDEMLQHIAETVVLPLFRRFEIDATNLAAAMAAFCGVLGTANEAAAQATAKQAFLVAMDTWQIAEMMKMGPAVSYGSGKASRDHIYSWKDGIGPCAVDYNVMEYHQRGTFPLDRASVRDYGLDALEYLLFSPSLNSICEGNDSPPDGWSGLSEAEKIAERCGYASLVADRLEVDARILVAEWADFIDTFVSGDFNQDEIELLQGDDMLYYAILLYTDKVMKELKLGMPFNFVYQLGGKNSTCGVDNEMCAKDLESQFAHISKENFQRNMVGFNMLYYGIGIDGTRGLGFRDLVADHDSDLAQDIEDAAKATKAAINRVSGTLRSLIDGGNVDDMDYVMDALDDLVTHLRDDVPQSTGLRLPYGYYFGGD